MQHKFIIFLKNQYIQQKSNFSNKNPIRVLKLNKISFKINLTTNR
jgi:hypothetical protein